MTGRVSILFGGDVFWDTGTVEIAPDVSELATQADLVAVNLEAPLTDRGEAYGPKPVHLRSQPGGIVFLKRLSVTLASLANNHICDWGEEGLKDTIRILREAGICHIGAGANAEDSQRSVVFDVNGLKVGFLAYGSIPMGTVEAGEKSFGSAAIRSELMIRQITEIRKNVDVVVVLVHWDSTRCHMPMPETVELGRRLIRAGATMVVGHHPHVIQGVEQYENGLIAYSLGNLVFADTVDGRRMFHLGREEQRGLLIRTQVAAHGIEKVEFIHTIQAVEDGAIYLRCEKDPSRTTFLDSLSRPLAVSDYGSFYRRYIAKRIVKKALLWVNPLRWGRIRKGHVRGFYLAIRRILLGRR